MKSRKQSQSPEYPYVACKSMSEMMDFVRQPGWKPQISAKLVTMLGIAANNETRLVGALRFLDLIDESGNPTSQFDELKASYKPTLKRLAIEKYRDLFSIIPPEMITRQRLKSFFGNPAQAADRRARFFIWLCREAAIDLPKVVDEGE